MQAMIWNEACGEARWDRDVSAAVTGRPACAALPAGIKQNRPVLSFGCELVGIVRRQHLGRTQTALIEGLHRVVRRAHRPEFGGELREHSPRDCCQHAVVCDFRKGAHPHATEGQNGLL